MHLLMVPELGGFSVTELTKLADWRLLSAADQSSLFSTVYAWHTSSEAFAWRRSHWADSLSQSPSCCNRPSVRRQASYWLVKDFVRTAPTPTQPLRR